MAASAFVSIFKKDKPASVSSYQPTPILNKFLKLFEFVVHNHISHYSKFILLHLPKPNMTPKQTVSAKEKCSHLNQRQTSLIKSMLRKKCFTVNFIVNKQNM